MATAKKTVKKSTTSKPKTASAATKPKTTASAAKKTATKKSTAKKTSAKKNDYQSFKLNEECDSFMTVRLSKQTIYWVVLGILAIAFAWYTISLTQSINDLYNQIDEIRAQDDSIVLPN